jgi:ankyrin repeat protein
LLKKGVISNGHDPCFQTPLCHPLIEAIRYKHYNVVKLLLKYGINPNVKDSQKKTALIIACENNSPYCIKKLLEHGCTMIETKTKTGYTPLMIACGYTNSYYNSKCSRYKKCVYLLLKYGANTQILKNYKEFYKIFIKYITLIPFISRSFTKINENIIRETASYL